MISRDLTCNETMPPLDDGDTKADLHRNRNGKAMSGKSSSGTVVSKPSPEFDTIGSLNHMTTVRDVVTRQFRNNKLNASADSSLVGYTKLGGILSSIGGHFDIISHNSQNQHQRHVLITNQDCNGFAHSSAEFHRHPMAPTAHSPAEEGWRNAHLSSTSTSTPSYSAASSVTKQTNLDIITKSGLHPSSSSNSLPPNAVTPSSSSLLNPVSKPNNNTTTSFFVKTVSTDGGAPAAAFISPSLPTGTMLEQQQRQQMGLLGSHNTFSQQQQPSQWAICPPVEHSLQSHQQHLKSVGVVSNRTSAAVVRIASPWAQRQMGLARTQQHKQNEEHRIPTSSTGPSVAIVLKQQQQPHPTPNSPQKQPQHTSPRPGILRGNAAAVRRLTIDRDRPASVSGAFINTSEESPRKRRKQHFDTTQLGDKITVTDRLGQSASAGPSLAGCWRNSSSYSMAENVAATQQRPLTADPLSRVGAAIGGKNSVIGTPSVEAKQSKKRGRPKLGVIGTPIVEGKQSKKRGRPKSNFRPQQLPLISTNATTKRSENMQQKQKNNQQTHEGTRENTKQQSNEERPQKQQKLPLGNQPMMTTTSTTHNGNAKMAKQRPIVVKVVTEPQQKKRKYQKRTPDIDPSIGTRKVSKKSSGRKSKKELAAEAASFQKTTEATNGGSEFAMAQSMKNDANCNLNHEIEFNDGQQPLPMEASEMMSKTATERDVINTLCRFKRNKDNREMLAERATPSSATFAAKPPSKFVVDPFQKDIADEHNQNPSCSYGTLNVGHHQQLPLLADLSKLLVLRSLLRRCERGLNSTDNCHLGESYEEICNFLRSSKRSPTMDCGQFTVDTYRNRFDCATYLTVPTHLDEHCIDRLSADIFCPTFNNFDEFKNATNSLRLLPVACAYFDASQRLLSSLRTSLRAFSLYHALQEPALTATVKDADDILVEQSDRWFFGDGNDLRTLVTIEEAETEEDDDAEDRREEKLSRAFFTKLDKEYQKYVGQPLLEDEGQSEENSNNGENAQLKMARKLLLQLEVAQTMDFVLHSVETGSTAPPNPHNFAHSLRSFAMPSDFYKRDSFGGLNGSLTFCGHSIDKQQLPFEVSKIVWRRRKIAGRRLNGRKRRKMSEKELDNDKNGKEEEEKEQQEQEEKEIQRHARTQTMKQNSPPLLKSIERFCTESASESTFLDGVANSVAQRMTNCQSGGSSFSVKASSSSDSILKCQSATAPSTAKRKRNNNSSTAKAHQFIFRPSRQMIEELFKFVQKLEEHCEPMAENSAQKNDAIEMQQKGNAIAVSTQPQQQKLSKANVEEMMANCQWGSAVALAQLRHKYPEILDRVPSSSSRDPIGDKQMVCTSQQFDRTLRLQFASCSTMPDGQSRFLELRLRGLREICATALALSRARAALAEQCAESVCETLEEIERQQQQHRRTKEQSLIFKAKSETTALKRVPSVGATVANSARPVSYSPSLVKLGTVRPQYLGKLTKLMPKQHNHRQRRMFLEEEEHEDERQTPTSGRGTPVEQQQGRQSPAKRAAHQRALTQMIISATASD